MILYDIYKPDSENFIWHFNGFIIPVNGLTAGAAFLFLLSFVNG